MANFIARIPTPELDDSNSEDTIFDKRLSIHVTKIQSFVGSYIEMYCAVPTSPSTEIGSGSGGFEDKAKFIKNGDENSKLLIILGRINMEVSKLKRAEIEVMTICLL
jgi:hypothetical protein